MSFRAIRITERKTPCPYVLFLKQCRGMGCPKWVENLAPNGEPMCGARLRPDGGLEEISDADRKKCLYDHRISSCLECYEVLGHCGG